ncbi:MAG: FKBP-type peptidyl-prolyl cis-trans isomerase [Bacteroidales bacterium]|nr:FKBP-type peptidyl-prolyl cis-trans isomerase [Bacteroidales bacterium]
MKHIIVIIFILMAGRLIPLHAQTGEAKEIDSVSFYLGYLYGGQISRSMPDGFNVDAFVEGAKRSVEAADINEEHANRFLQHYFTRMQQKINDDYLQEGRKFLAENAKKQGVITLPDGLQYRVITAGTGSRQPLSADEVEVMYHGTLPDGTVFDSSRERGTPAVFPVSGVIPGFSEALQMMTEGAKWEIYIPAELGYGERVNPQSGIKPNSVLIFEIELLKILVKEQAIPVAEPNLLK